MSEPQYHVSQEDDASSEDIESVREGLFDYNRPFAPDDKYQPLRLFLRDADGRIMGGLLGETFWDWLHIEIFWLQEDARHLGHGSVLLTMAEEEARRRGCQRAYLDTLSFQARPFYEKHGYIVFATQEDFPPGHTRYFLQKRL